MQTETFSNITYKSNLRKNIQTNSSKRAQRVPSLVQIVVNLNDNTNQADEQLHLFTN